jgi:hypothetical protein
MTDTKQNACSSAPNGSLPPIEIVAWVFAHVAQHLREGGSYRHLIYDRMGYGPDAYLPLCEAGGLEISNAFHDLAVFQKANSVSDESARPKQD